LIVVRENQTETKCNGRKSRPKMTQQSKTQPKFIEPRPIGDERIVSEDNQLESISALAFRIMVLVVEYS
jgi:hypothetical protein